MNEWVSVLNQAAQGASVAGTSRAHTLPAPTQAETKRRSFFTLKKKWVNTLRQRLRRSPPSKKKRNTLVICAWVERPSPSLFRARTNVAELCFDRPALSFTHSSFYTIVRSLVGYRGALRDPTERFIITPLEIVNKWCQLCIYLAVFFFC